jgi:cytochrome c
VRPAVGLAIVCALGCVAHAPAQNTSQSAAAEKLIKDSDCSSCHAVDRDIVGPAYSDIAKRYAGQADASGKISAKIRNGGGGMTPHPDMSEAQRDQIAQWILGQKDSAASSSAQSSAAAAAGRSYTYTGKDGAAVTLDFPLFLEGQTSKVTKDVFHGYQLWNSYCYRCQGTDATGGQLAPDLRRSLTGMKQQEFTAVTMEGRKEKGMPSWAGFLSPDDVLHIYKYAKGRSLELVPTGRPPSAQD